MENNKRKTGAELIAEERQRQIEVEGYTAEHDEQHSVETLCDAGIAYAMACTECADYASAWGPDDWEFKPKTPRENLIRAGALIAAALDRLDAQEMDIAIHKALHAPKTSGDV